MQIWRYCNMSQAMNMMTDMAMQSVRQNNLDTERSRLSNISSSKDAALKERELRKAAEGFEAIFIQKMWDEMRSSLPKNGIHYSKEEEYWQSMYSQELGKSMASAGGIGLADMMVEQLTKPAVNSPQTGALSRIRMAVEPAPLVPQENLQAEKKNEQQTQNGKPAQNQTNAPQAAAPGFYEEYNPQQAAVLNRSVNAETAAVQNTDSRSAQSQSEQQIQQARQEPQIIRTTYITNLPPQKREHAILDQKGNPIKKTERTASAAEIKTPTKNDYFDRSLSITRTVKPENTAPMEQQPIPAARQNIQTEAEQSAQNKQEHDILAGITTTYIPYHQRMAMIEASQAEKARQNTAPASPAAQLAQNQESPRSFKLPSLEEALTMGTLVASLTDSEIAAISKNSTVLPNEKKRNTAALADKAAPAVGGGTILATPPEVKNISPLAPQTEFQMPVQGSVRSSFGWRIDPINRQRAWHTGIDIQAAAGSSVTAGKSGTVSFAGHDEQLGNMIVIDHGSGIESVYGHNAELMVKKGDTVSSGTQIAKVGSSGRTNGSHLHFEIRQNGLSINPEPFFSKEEIS